MVKQSLGTKSSSCSLLSENGSIDHIAFPDDHFDLPSSGMNHGFACAPDRRLDAIVGYTFSCID
jgi:hypothetical protein